MVKSLVYGPFAQEQPRLKLNSKRIPVNRCLGRRTRSLERRSSTSLGSIKPFEFTHHQTINKGSPSSHSGPTCHNSRPQRVLHARQPSTDSICTPYSSTYTNTLLQTPQLDSSSSNSSPTHSTLEDSPSHSSSTLALPRQPYQPRPLLLSTFGAQNRRGLSRASWTNNSDQKLVSSSSSSSSAIVLRQRSMAELEIDQRQRQRAQTKLVHELERKRKRARAAEVSALDPDWSWLSSDDSFLSEEEEEEEEEEMAVVWRASLDVGRRVSRDRKALGKGHGLKLSNSTTTTTQSSSSIFRPTTLDLFRSSSKLINPLGIIKNLRISNGINYGRVVLFGSGIMGGLICSMLSNSWGKMITSPSIGLFINIFFPRNQGPFVGIGLGGVGIFYQW